MKAVIYNQLRDSWNLVSKKKPIPKDGETLIRITHAGLCGSDMHRINAPDLNQTMFSLGHEIGGIVEKSPLNPGLEGKKVVVNPIINCGSCSNCKSEKSQFCSEIVSIGKTMQGGFSEYLCVPDKQVYVLPEDMNPQTAVLVDGVAVLVNALSKTPNNLNKLDVLVSGDGTIGALSLAVLMAQNKNSRLVLSGKNQENTEKLKKIYNAVGVEDVPNSNFDVCIETVGRNQSDTFNLTLEKTNKGGTVLVLGVYPEDYLLEFNARKTFYKEITISSINSFVISEGRDDFAQAIKIISENEQLFLPLITHQFPLQDFNKGVECMRNKSSTGAIKVAFNP